MVFQRQELMIFDNSHNTNLQIQHAVITKKCKSIISFLIGAWRWLYYISCCIKCAIYKTKWHFMPAWMEPFCLELFSYYCLKRQILAQHCMAAPVKGSRLQLNNKIKATANYDEIRSEDKDETNSMSLSEWFSRTYNIF